MQSLFECIGKLQSVAERINIGVGGKSRELAQMRYYTYRCIVAKWT